MTYYELKAKIKRHNAICAERDRMVKLGADEDSAWSAAVESYKSALEKVKGQ
jgi:hypothetical protein